MTGTRFAAAAVLPCDDVGTVHLPGAVDMHSDGPSHPDHPDGRSHPELPEHPDQESR